MERLWTPWRAAYVTAAEKPPGCFLCRAPEGTEDAEHLLLYRGMAGFVIMNRYPYNTGHLLIAPYAHMADFPALPAETAAELMALTQRCVQALGDEYAPGGFNVGMNLGAVAGAGEADHLHVHVVPRWPGDTNFMPIVADVKVLPETLDQTYERLRPRFAAP
jgi:ATP adenylyltransferase